MKKYSKVLIFVILSVLFSNNYGQSPNNTVTSNVNLNANVNVINDSIKEIREDFEIYKRILKAEFDNKIDAVNQENDGRFQVFQILFGIVVTVLLFVIGYSRYEVSNFIKNDANDKIKFEVTNVFDDKFEKNRKQIDDIKTEARDLLTEIKEIQASALLEKNKINISDIKKEIKEEISKKKPYV